METRPALAMASAARTIGVIVAAVGAMVLAGWALDIEVLKRASGPITMKANAAIAFLLCGASLWALRGRLRLIGAGCALAAAAIGAATLWQHLLGWDLGIDQLLFHEAPNAVATTSPNRMGLNASTSFALAGSALLLLHLPWRRAILAAQTMSFIALSFSLLAITGYIYGVEQLYGVARVTAIGQHTAVTLMVLHLGILSASTGAGLMALFASDGAAGTMLRRLTTSVIVLPLVLGYVAVRGEQGGLYDIGTGMALVALSVIGLLLATLWRTAVAIDRSDVERREAQAAAQTANQLKDQFIAMLSHELRTPLNVMLGRLRLLEIGGGDERGRARNAGIVARNGRLLARLVEDLLDLSRASAGQFEIAPSAVQLNAVVRTAIDTAAADAADKGVQVAGSLDPDVGIVHVDQQRIQQVVSNLLTNAVKFTPPGGRVDVTTARSAEEIVITVTDTGIGFDEQFARHMFEPFRQADASSRRQHGGLGLGLSIAKLLIERHGGRISAASAGTGAGATFTVVLPLPSEGRAPQPGPVPALDAGERTRRGSTFARAGRSG